MVTIKKYDKEIQSSTTLRISSQPLQCLVLLLMCHLNTAKFRSTGATVAEENIVIRGLRLNDFESVAPAFRCCGMITQLMRLNVNNVSIMHES